MLGAGLLLNIVSLILAGLLAILLVGFNFVLIRVILDPSKEVKDCGCSTNSVTSPKQALARNTLLLGLLAVIAYLEYLPDSSSTRPNQVLFLLEVIFLVTILLWRISPFSSKVKVLLFGGSPKLLQATSSNDSSIEGHTNRRNFLRLGLGTGIGLIALNVMGNSQQVAHAAECPDNQCHCGIRYRYPIDCGSCQPCTGSPCYGRWYIIQETHCCTSGGILCNETIVSSGDQQCC